MNHHLDNQNVSKITNKCKKKDSWIEKGENLHPGDSNRVYVKFLTCVIGGAPDHLGKIPMFLLFNEKFKAR